ncbi:TlyA family RNA methyltransferase [Paludicola sp. MB14-C6]|uniref:TlyA family RNA methyltransferase n=1 Tax=Paludihabitans sp. MB14-C6 TaxID=3070656 RepID=UPI0027DE4FE9|nr:TlyA family RNA methyltransferase [Paludicola sp. MB14-C6]WMJ23036.1 TlyA family RNA methyltransferase [Paludicola sp. MB14-C6]
MVEKKRLDLLLVEKGLCESREKAKALIMSGNVFIGNERCDKAGMTVLADSEIELKGSLKYVSRGGLKLEKAIDLYQLDLTGKVCMDIGASTGGFTDCMLQNGASKVFSVDVGYGQLAWSLRTDERVVNMERTNIRYVTDEQIKTKLDFASIDVSFISLTLVLPVLSKLINDNGQGLCLVKPQFEAGKEKVGKKGVVRELSTHIEVCKKIYDFLPTCGFSLIGATFSPIKGPEGNIEYLYYIQKSEEGHKLSFDEVETMVKCSHDSLK